MSLVDTNITRYALRRSVAHNSQEHPCKNKRYTPIRPSTSSNDSVYSDWRNKKGAFTPYSLKNRLDKRLNNNWHHSSDVIATDTIVMAVYGIYGISAAARRSRRRKSIIHTIAYGFSWIAIAGIPLSIT